MTKKLIQTIEVSKGNDSKEFLSYLSLNAVKALQDGKELSIGTPEETKYSLIYPIYEDDDSGMASVKLSLPTEDEVYAQALCQRASNMRDKLYRLNQDIRDEAESLAKKSEEAMRTKMELNVLLEELGPEVVGELDPNRKPNFTQDENLATRVQDASDRLKYTGPQILKAYAQLKAVFDIDNERPPLRDFTFSREDQFELSRYLSGKPGGHAISLEYLRKLQRKQFPLDQLERRGVATSDRIELAKKHYRFYVEGKIRAEN